MKLLFRGHDDRYALEQSLLAFFPEERPVYEPAQPEEDHAVVSLHEGKTYTTATTRLTYHGQTARGMSRVVLRGVDDEYERERLRQKALKLSFFKAAREITGQTPSWGALTGIRPGKIAARFLEQGKSERQTDRILRDTYFVAPERRRLAIETAKAGLKAKAELAPNEISLYVGIPFCPTRCAYCSFVSASVEKSFSLMEPYLQVLEREITDAARMVQETGLKIKSFYMGGGTPTTLSSAQMDRLLAHLNRSFDLSGCVEYCVEAGRPDTIDRDKLQVLLDRGVDRISVNPQSLEDHVLSAIGRKHSAADIERTMELAMSMNFPHVNMDLIAGLPEDTPEGFRRTLDKCLTYGADNITVHTLALKKGSRILLEGSKIPSAQEVGEMLDYANPALRAAGFAPYYLYRQKYMSGSFENVGWCISGAEGLYNIYIMEELHSILSLGAGGSTKMVDAGRGRIERVFHAKFPNEYIQRPEKLQENLDSFRAFHENMLK
ncbi:MAG: coproporphyrinogen dehydrogenase HemZ [Ruminococcaceae bacterium]|nr:coproporphyrinogen dehydrogenase HemZ [Oscillospiraceae bacterium]